MSEGLAANVEGSRQRTLWLATLGFFGGFAGVAVFGPMVPEFVDAMGLSPLQAGLLASIPNLTGSLLRIPFGAWVDRVGGRLPLTILLGLTLLGMAGLLFVLWRFYPDNMDGLYLVLLGLGVFIGCGIATFSVGISQVSYWYPQGQQGGPLGIYAGLGNTGPGLFSWVLPAVVAALGILAAYGLWFVGLAIITVAYAIFVKDAPSFQLQRQGVEVTEEKLEEYRAGSDPQRFHLRGTQERGLIPSTWALVYFYFVSFGGFLALTAWLPTYWTQTHAVAATTAGLLTLVFSLLSALIRVPGGLLSDQISIRYALTGNFALIILGSVMVAINAGFCVALIGTILIAAGMGLQNAIVFKLIAYYVPRAVGGASGWVGGLGAFGGFVVPPVMGIIAGAVAGPAGYALGFLIIAGLALLGIVVVGWLTNWTWQSDPQQSKEA